MLIIKLEAIWIFFSSVTKCSYQIVDEKCTYLEVNVLKEIRGFPKTFQILSRQLWTHVSEISFKKKQN